MERSSEELLNVELLENQFDINNKTSQFKKTTG